MTNVHLPTDTRFRRARIRPPRRRRAVVIIRRVVHGLLLAAVAALGIHWGPTLVDRSAHLRIDTVVVKGNRYLSSGEVAALLGPLQGVSILLADLDVHRERLLASGWVKAATLRRLIPSTVEVTVEEREPVGLARVADRLYLIDAAGTVIDEYGPAFTGFRLPIIDGLAPRRARGGETDGERARLVARLIAALDARPDLSGRVSQIDVADARDAVVLLNDDPALLHLGTEHFVERLDKYLELATTLQAQVREVDHVDLRFERRVYVRPAGDADGL